MMCRCSMKSMCPVNKPVICYISSKDVIHSFRLMAMRVTQDAIPGMRIPIWFKPMKEGRFRSTARSLCGNGSRRHGAAAAGGGKPGGLRQMAGHEGRRHHQLRVKPFLLRLVISPVQI